MRPAKSFSNQRRMAQQVPVRAPADQRGRVGRMLVHAAAPDEKTTAHEEDEGRDQQGSVPWTSTPSRGRPGAGRPRPGIVESRVDRGHRRGDDPSDDEQPPERPHVGAEPGPEGARRRVHASWGAKGSTRDSKRRNMAGRARAAPGGRRKEGGDRGSSGGYIDPQAARETLAAVRTGEQVSRVGAKPSSIQARLRARSFRPRAGRRGGRGRRP